MTRHSCPRCGKVMREDRFVCDVCVAGIEADLFDLAQFALWADDKRARVRSPMAGAGGGGARRDAPLPFDPRVSPVMGPAAEVIARGVAATAKVCPSWSYPTSSSTSSRALWLLTKAGFLAGMPWGPDLVDAITWAAAGVRRVFDNAPERIYLGRCGTQLGEDRTCWASLYAEADPKGYAPAFVACPTCATSHDVRSRRGELAESVAGYLGTAREIARLLSLTLGEAASERMVWAYARRGLIVPRGDRMELDIKGRQRMVSVYRIGEVMRAAERARRDDEERQLQRRRDRARRTMASLRRHADARKGA